MLKGLRIFLTVVVMACSAACGSNGSTTTITHYQNYSSVAITPGSIQMGGAVQGTPLPLATKAPTSISVSTIAGGSSGTADNHPVDARFNTVNGITTYGNSLYVTDFSNHTIRRVPFDNSSTTTIAGSPGFAGSNSVLNNDGSLYSAYGNSALFNYPSGITTDGSGNLYVADYNNDTIRQIVLPVGTTPVVVRTIAGSPGIVGSVDDTIGANARFNHPTDITTDGKNLYVTDTGNQTIRKIGLTPPYNVHTVAGSPGNNGSNPVAPATVLGSDARFKYPARITTDGRNLYVTDFVNNTISRIAPDPNNPSNTLVTTIAGTPGVTGSADGVGAAASFRNINGITSDGTNLYVVDSNNHTVRMIDPAGNVTTIAGSPGVTGGTDGTGAEALFKYPIGITTDGTSLYVTDSYSDPQNSGSSTFTIRKIQ